MPEEEKIMGYSKKTVRAVVVLVLVAGAMFYAGAKYEKSKLSKLGLLKNGTEQVAKTKKAKAMPVAAAAAPVKFADQDYAKSAYLISGDTLTADAKTALTGFSMSKVKNADGSTTVTLKALKPEYHDQVYTLKAGEQLYFIEKFLQDDVNGVEKNIGDDTAAIVDAAGMVVEAPRDFTK